MIGTADFPKISHPKKCAFLAAFSRCGSLSKAAKRAKVDRRTHYNWLKDDAGYVQAFRQAVIEAGDSLQDKLTEMAFDGNVTAAIFLLKGLKPERFRERIEVRNIQDLKIEDLPPDIFQALAEHFMEQATQGDPAKIAKVLEMAEVLKELPAGTTVVDGISEALDATT